MQKEGFEKRTFNSVEKNDAGLRAPISLSASAERSSRGALERAEQAAGGRLRRGRPSGQHAAPGRRLGFRAAPSVGKISAKCCSFSAVSAPFFARKYAFFSIFQNLQDYLAEFLKNRQIFAALARLAKL